jgi:hypothetical protein
MAALRGVFDLRAMENSAPAGFKKTASVRNGKRVLKKVPPLLDTLTVKT